MSFYRQIFDIHPCSVSRDLQTEGVLSLANEFCLLRGVNQQFRTWLILLASVLVYFLSQKVLGNFVQ